MKISYGEYCKDRSRQNYMSARARHREIVRVIVKRTKNSVKVLDSRCREGHILKILPASSEKYGIDLSENVKNRHIEELM
jgi:hypothetical protein